MLADSRYKGVDADGNPLSVQFSIMPDEGKLLLANASNTCPDVALSVTGDRAYQLGLRHAVAPLSVFRFSQYITDKFWIPRLSRICTTAGFTACRKRRIFTCCCTARTF